jgi:hypothetical protein
MGLVLFYTDKTKILFEASKKLQEELLFFQGEVPYTLIINEHKAGLLDSILFSRSVWYKILMQNVATKHQFSQNSSCCSNFFLQV